MPNETITNLTYLAGIEPGHPDTESRVNGNSLCPGDQLTRHSKRGKRVDWVQKLMQANKIGVKGVTARHLVTLV